MNSATQTLGPAKPASVVLKAVMAVTGLAMALWLTLHMLGNLLVFAGPDVMNGYALKLHASGLLWPMRSVLSVILLAHVACAVLTTQRGWAARTQRYRFALRRRASTGAARSMRFGGAALLLYLLYHVSQVYGVGQAAYVPGDVYRNLIGVLRQPQHVAVYLGATWFAALHLAHGLGSALISLGVVARGRERLLQRALRVWVWSVGLGFTLVAVAPCLKLA